MHCQHCGRPLIVNPGQSASNSCSPACLASARAARTSVAIDAAQRLLGRWAETPLKAREPARETTANDSSGTAAAEPALATFDISAEVIADDLAPEAVRPDPGLSTSTRWGIGLAIGGLVVTALGGALLVWIRPRLELDALSLVALTAAMAGQIALLAGIGVLIESGRGPMQDDLDAASDATRSSQPVDRLPAERRSA